MKNNIKLLRRTDVQEFLNISRTTVFRLEKQGILKPIYIGTAKRYRIEDVNALIKKGGTK